MDSTTLAIIIVGFLIMLWNLDFVASLLNLKALTPELPTEFVGVYEQEKYSKSQAYTAEGTRFDITQSIFSLCLLLGFWFSGGFQWLDELVRGLHFNPTLTGLCYIGTLGLGSMIISLPWSYYENFVIEEKFGFNKMTKRTFMTDAIKSLLVTAIIGAGLMSGLFWIFENVAHAWIWAWAFYTAFTLLLTYLAPTFLLPIFNKFKPMEDGFLKDAIFEMAEKCQFPLTDLYVMDGSKRSTKANAFFTGFGKRKKIALFDTLIKEQSQEEIVAVLAHEIGHFKCKHIIKRMSIGIIKSAVVFFLLGLITTKDSAVSRTIFDAFKVEHISIYIGIILFAILFNPISRILGVFSAASSRKDEFEADAYAKHVQGTEVHLISALKKLSVQNLANLTPHPLRVFLDHSHPPMMRRIDALRGSKDTPTLKF